jgi:CBS domain-containing protein
MRPGVLAVPADAQVAVVAAILASHDVHSVVLDQAGEPVLATDLDILRAFVAEEPVVRPAREELPHVAPDATLAEAARTMAARDVRHLAVVAPGATLPAGMLSTLDVASVIAGRDPRIARLARPHAARPATSVSRPERLRVRDVMHHGVIACAGAASLEEVAGVLADRRVHCVSVSDIRRDGAGERLVWGLVSDGDVVAAAAAGGSPTAAQLAATEPLAIGEGELVSTAAELMVEHDVTHVVAVSTDGAPSGVVSALDVIGVLAVAAHDAPLSY